MNTAKPRNWAAQAAHFRNSAGVMKHKNTPRGGSNNDHRDALDLYQEDMEIAEEISDLTSEEESGN